ncbi:hypothetical protein [Moorena producens]|uniref:hypothetical protein n=1 Tax=Moorena producens TaxID=1155739 RepID=UPI00131442F3|nr:hypothetical protein [Moorena producens]
MRYKYLGFRDFGAGTEAVGHATRTEQVAINLEVGRGKKKCVPHSYEKRYQLTTDH